MKFLRNRKTAPIGTVHPFADLFGVRVPLPALQRDWLHGREQTRAWMVEDIAARIGAACWFSHYYRDPRDSEPESRRFALHAIAGFWPYGGFVELIARGYPLDERPQYTLGIYTESPGRTQEVMDHLLAHYCHRLDCSSDSEKR